MVSTPRGVVYWAVLVEVWVFWVPKLINLTRVVAAHPSPNTHLIFYLPDMGTCFDPCFPNLWGFFFKLCTMLEHFSSLCLAQIPSNLHFALKHYDFSIFFCKNIDCFKEKWGRTDRVPYGQNNRHICVSSVLLLKSEEVKLNPPLKSTIRVCTFSVLTKKVRGSCVLRKVHRGSGWCFLWNQTNNLCK